MEAERRFRAMGTTVHVVVHGSEALADLAQAEIERLERQWSRFIATSEVAELNRRAGHWVPVSAETMDLVERAILGHAITDGDYDPTVLGDVIRAGYDTSFDDLVAAGDRVDPPTSPLRRGIDDIALDAAAHAVHLPSGVGFDPGGIGKGLAADLVASRIDAEGAAGVMINLGGDLRAIGFGPAGDDWTVDLDPAATGTPLATIALEHGAVATSTVLRRRWMVGGIDRHHLIDPATGRPANTDVVAVSVVSAHGWQAEVLAEGALVGGLEQGLDLIERQGADGLLVDVHGGLHRTAGFDRFVVTPRTLEGTPS